MLGDLTKLLNQGFVEGEYLYPSKDGDFRFELRTLSPLEELEAQRAAKAQRKPDDIEAADLVYLAIEMLARATTKVNGIVLENVPGAEGQDSLSKKKSILKKVGESVLVGLWQSYQKLKTSTTLSGSQEEAEQIKK